MASQLPRILRNYRNAGPTKFHKINQTVRTAVCDKTRIPDTIWRKNPSLLQSYLAASEKHDALYHESMLGSKLVIAERDILQAQLVIYLDEIAYVLEMAAVRTPEIIIASGFALTKERRGHPRAKISAATRDAARLEQGEGENNTSS